MSLFDVHPDMQGRSSVADADDALTGVTDPALAAFLADVRVLATAPAPEATGDLAIVLRDGFEPVVPARRPAAPRTAPLRRWASRTAILGAPLGLKIAAAATAAAATFGGAAAVGALPDGLQQWASDVARTVDVTIPDGRGLAGVTSFDPARPGREMPLSKAADRAAPAAVDDYLRGDTAVERDAQRAEVDAPEERRDRAEDAADDERDAAEDRADDERDAAEDARDDERDAAEDQREAAEDRADDEADATEDRADDQADAEEDRTDERADAAEDAEREAAEQAEDAAEEAEDRADEAQDGAQDTTD